MPRTLVLILLARRYAGAENLIADNDAVLLRRRFQDGRYLPCCSHGELVAFTWLYVMADDI